MMSTIQAHIVTIQMAASTCQASNATRPIYTPPKAPAWWHNTNRCRTEKDAAWDGSWQTWSRKHSLSWNASSSSANNTLHLAANKATGKSEEDIQTIGKEPTICNNLGAKTIGNPDKCDR